MQENNVRLIGTLYHDLMPEVVLVNNRIQDLIEYYGRDAVNNVFCGCNADAMLELHFHNLVLTYGFNLCIDVFKELFTINKVG